MSGVESNVPTETKGKVPTRKPTTKSKKPLVILHEPRSGIEQFNKKIETFPITGEPSTDVDNLMSLYESWFEKAFPNKSFQEVINTLNQ
jgi:hypothetical protein